MKPGLIAPCHAELTEAEWRSLESLVAKQRLLSWKARPTGVIADDYSHTEFSLRARDQKVVNDQRWSQPVQQDEQPRTLAVALGALAKARVKSPALHYLVP